MRIREGHRTVLRVIAAHREAPTAEEILAESPLHPNDTALLLRQLFDAGYVDDDNQAQPVDKATPRRYVLTTKGRTLL